VRRALGVCVMAVLVVGVLAYAQDQASTTPQAIGHSQPVVIAKNISARALALDPEAKLDVSLVSPQNRFFQLSVPAASNTANAAPVRPFVGTGVAGSAGDGGSALSAELDLIPGTLFARSGIAVGPDGSVYIADTQNATIRRVAGPDSSEPGVIRSIAGRWAPKQNVALVQPEGVALDRAGNLYIADRGAGALDVLREDSGTLESVAQIVDAVSVAVSPDGTKAFVAAAKTGSVIAVDLVTHSLETEASVGASSATSLKPEVSSGSPCDTAARESAQFCPSGLAVDAGGNLFVSDLWAGRVWRVDARTGAGAVAIAGLQMPGALAFDATGRNLYVVEQGENRIIVAEGMGPAGTFSLTPSAATFVNEPTGGISAQQQFILTNNTLNPVSGFSTLLQSAAAGTQNDFTQESTSCLPTLGPSATCAINVSFTPTKVQAFNYTMDLVDSSSNSLLTAPSTLTGTGDDYQLGLASGQVQELSVIQGQSATFHLQVSALGVFGQNGEQVSFLCPNNFPAETTCTFSAASVSPAAGATAPFSITFTTSSNNVHSRVPPGFPARPGPPTTPWYIGAGALAALLFGLARSRRRGVLIGPAALAAVAIFVGCHHATITSNATPAGAVTMTVQGAALDKNGNPLNATRGVTIILDVIAK
jgi:sugar lactone lactonase YvrE